MTESEGRTAKVKVVTIVALVTLLVTITASLVGILTTGWLHMKLECSNNEEGVGIDVGLYQLCYEGQECRSRASGEGGSLQELANHLNGQTVQDKVALALLSASTALEVFAFILLCVILCVPKKGLAKVAWVFCTIACFLLFVGCAIWTGFLVYAEIADIWDVGTLPESVLGNGTNCIVALFDRYQWGDQFPLQHSFFLAWIAFLLASIDVGLAKCIMKRFRTRPDSQIISFINQTNVQPTTNVNVGAPGGQPPAPASQNMSPNQIILNPGDINMTQSHDSSQVNDQQTMSPNQVVVGRDGFPSVRSNAESLDSHGYMKVMKSGLQ